MASRPFSSTSGVEDKPALLRQIGVTSATAIVISNMVGTGVFASTGFMAGDLGSAPLILLVWAIGAMAALIGALCYSELGINFPSSGGEYVYLTQAYGPTWGFMSGWVSFFAGFSAPIAAAALTFSDYVGYFFPGLNQANAQFSIGPASWEWRVGGAQAVACSLVAVFTVLNFFGVQRVAKVQNWLTAIKVAVIGAFLILGLTAGTGNWHNFSVPAARWTSTPIPAQIAISLFFVYFAYSGWNAATYVAEELRQPARTLPLALLAGTVIVGVLFIGLNVAYIYAVPLEQMKGVVAVGALAASHLFGKEVAGIFSALMALSLLATVNAMVTIGPRVYYAMAKNGAFFASAARVNPRWHTPVVAIIAQGVCTMCITLTPFYNLIAYIGFSLNFFAVLSVISLMIFRHRPGWRKIRVVSFAYPLIPSMFILIGSWMTYQGIQRRPWVSLAAGLTVATGAIFYHARLAKSRPA